MTLFSFRFVDSLSAKVHSTPPTIDKISALFQDFYVKADSHISVHISTLASRINREAPLSSGLPMLNQKDNTTLAEKVVADRQMLTASEFTEKRRARKQLSYKKIALEETVERRACERIYSKIWRHKSTLDEERDEKLRSKTAALSLLGIGLKDLGIEISASNIMASENTVGQFAAARESLMHMNDEKYPEGKLKHLIGAHKVIVESLTNILPSSSSADEILPALIYTLISSSPEGINIISNLLFIQRFRSASKITGEAAYCLTNLDAAITFLEDIDISSVGAEPVPGGQPRLLSASMMPNAEKVDPLISLKQAASPTLTHSPTVSEFNKSDASGTDIVSAISLQRTAQQNRLSNLFQPPSKVLEAANDAVRNTADQGLKNISNTLDNSFNFFFGRLKEMQSNQRSAQKPVVPKTLDEARRLVTSPTVVQDTVIGSQGIPRPTSEDPERSTTRDRSVDSSKSNDSYSKRPYHSTQKDHTQPSLGVGSPIATPNSAATPLESVRNFSNTINPLSHIPGMIRGFGRLHSESNTPPLSSTAGGGLASSERLKLISSAPIVPQSSSAGMVATRTAVPINPPIKHFLEIDDPQDLKLGEVAELLKDYKRLAAALALLDN